MFALLIHILLLTQVDGRGRWRRAVVAAAAGIVGCSGGGGDENEGIDILMPPPPQNGAEDDDNTSNDNNRSGGDGAIAGEAATNMNIAVSHFFFILSRYSSEMRVSANFLL